MRHRDATVERVEFLTNGELRARTGHGENLLPDDAPLCLLTLHGKFAHEVPPFLSRPQREIPLADQLVVTFHGVTGNRLSEGFVHQKKPVDNSGSSGASQ
jgi:hypothetical protein